MMDYFQNEKNHVFKRFSKLFLIFYCIGARKQNNIKIPQVPTVLFRMREWPLLVSLILSIQTKLIFNRINAYLLSFCE